MGIGDYEAGEVIVGPACEGPFKAMLRICPKSREGSHQRVLSREKM